MKMFTPPALGYDRAITIFSPDGRLFQVEYALESVRKGWTTVGAKCSDGAVLAVEKRKISALVDPSSQEKILKLDDHIGLAFAGLSSDARILIDRARLNCQLNRLYYDEPIDIEVLTKRICDIKQLYTQHAGVRPFGVSFLIAGVDRSGVELFMTEPSGAYAGYQGYAIGSGQQTVMEFFEKGYASDMKLEDAISLTLKALGQVVEGPVDSTKVEMATIDKETGAFKKIPPERLQEYINALKAAEG